MSLRVGLNFGSTAGEEGQDVGMQDLSSWTATGAVLKAGRGLSSWLFNNISPPASPSTPSFFGKGCWANEQSGCTVTLIQSVESNSTPASAVSSPINALPQELLESIFWEYLFGHTATQPFLKDTLQGSYRRIKTMIGATTTPFTLAHVCSSWRAVVLSCPSLWSKLCACRPEARDMPLFEFWISQSSGCPLDLRVVERGRDEMEKMDSTAYQVLSLAFQQSHRLLSLQLQLQQDMEDFFISFPDLLLPSPLLETVVLDIGNWSSEGYQAISRLLSRSPVLRQVSWGKRCPVTPFIYKISWADLVKIAFRSISLVDLLLILPLASSLQSLAIHSLEMDDPSLLQNANIQLTHLSSLTLESYGGLSPLLDLLDTPSLTSLALPTGLGHAGAPGAGWASLAGLVQRSGCRISSLDWNHTPLTDEAEAESVKAFDTMVPTVLPHLCHLRIGSPVRNGTIDVLTLHPDCPSSPLPYLRSLELRDCEADINSVGAMITSRPNLHCVEISLRHGEGGIRYIRSTAASVYIFSEVEV